MREDAEQLLLQLAAPQHGVRMAVRHPQQVGGDDGRMVDHGVAQGFGPVPVACCNPLRRGSFPRSRRGPQRAHRRQRVDHERQQTGA